MMKMEVHYSPKQKFCSTLTAFAAEPWSLLTYANLDFRSVADELIVLAFLTCLQHHQK